MDDHLILIQISFAFGPSGHVEKYERVSVVRPMRTFGYLDTDLMKASAVFMALMALKLALNEFKTLRKIGPSSYFIHSDNNIWNCYEILFFAMFVYLFKATYEFWVDTEVTEKRFIAARAAGSFEDDSDSVEFVDAFNLKSSFRVMLRSVSFLVFMSLFKIFKFMNFSDNLNFMFKVVTRSKNELIGFMVVYFLLIACFAFLASTLFGYEMREFHNFASSLTSCVRLSVGILDFDYNVMKEAEGFWAPLFLVGFVFIAMLIAVNMFISILSEYYEQVKNETNQWNEDIEIFELQGMTVPSSSITGNTFDMYNKFWLKFTLMIEVDPPHMPREVMPVDKLVGPSWGDGEHTDATCYANTHPDASNLIRLHYFSEFVPVELENTRGRGRANIPIIGQISDSKGLHSHCVGLGKTESPINELIEEYGKLWDDSRWECSTPNCGKEYDEHMDGAGLPIEEHISKNPSWACPRCRMNATSKVAVLSESQQRNTFDHVEMMGCFRRAPTHQQTVACLKLHNDDMHQEVRPQVLSKMRARFNTYPNPKDPTGQDLDVDFVNQNNNADTLDLMEDEFGAKIKLECLLHEEMTEDVMSGGKIIGRAKDAFALFRVVEISSHEHYSGDPTELHLAEGMWNPKHDRLIFQQDSQAHRQQGSQDRTNSQMAEIFNKSVREVELRRRFLKRLHRDDEGYPVTPKQLKVEFQPGAMSAMRMWRESLKDSALKVVSPTYAFNSIKKNMCKCTWYRDKHHKDMKAFIRKQIQHIRDNTNGKDLTELEGNFLKQNMSLEAAIGKMKVNLINSGKRSPEFMRKHYGKVGVPHYVAMDKLDEHGKKQKVDVTVEEKLKTWLMQKYADEIDCVIMKEDEEEEEKYHDEMGGGEEMSRMEKMKMRRSMSSGVAST